MGVSSREKINTNRNLARVTTKSRVRRRQSLMDVSVEGEEMDVLRSIPCWRPCQMSKIRSQVVLRAMFNGDKTYDNQTEEIHRSQRTTYREGNYWFTGTSNLLGWRLEGVCN